MLLRLADTGEARGTIVVLCSFAPCDSEFDCIEQMTAALDGHQTLKEHFSKGFKDLAARLKGIRLGPVGIDLETFDRDRWRDLGEQVTQSLAALNRPIVVCVDELPVFILKLLGPENDTERVRAFLNWFRNLRQEQADTVKWVLAGSIGLDTVTARLGIGDTINDLTPFPLEAFDEKVADGLLTKLAASYQVDLQAEIRSYMMERVGWLLPYYLQLLFRTVLENLPDAGKVFTRSAVDDAFEEVLRPPFKNYFDYWRQRLFEELGKPHADYAIAILNTVCADPNGTVTDTLSQMGGASI